MRTEYEMLRFSAYQNKDGGRIVWECRDRASGTCLGFAKPNIDGDAYFFYPAVPLGFGVEFMEDLIAFIKEANVEIKKESDGG